MSKFYWITVAESRYPWERDSLDFLCQRCPVHELVRHERRPDCTTPLTSWLARSPFGAAGAATPGTVPVGSGARDYPDEPGEQLDCLLYAMIC